jgi:hypothetical protein
MPRMAEDTPRGQSRSENADTSGESGWITTEVAARAVRVSPRTIRRYIEAKPQGEGVRREWLISVDSLHALRATRPPSADVPEVAREVEHADSIADVLRDMSASLVARAEEAAELRVRLQLTEQAQSTIEEGRRRVEEELAEERRRREACRETGRGPRAPAAGAPGDHRGRRDGRGGAGGYIAPVRCPRPADGRTAPPVVA